MKRFTVIFLVILIMPANAHAESFSAEEYNEALRSYDFSFFEETLDKDTYRSLEELGLTDFTLQSVTSMRLTDLVRLLLSQVKKRMKSPLEGFTCVLLYIVLSSLFQSMKSEQGTMHELYSVISALAIASLLVVQLAPCLTLVNAAMRIAADFVYAFVPVFAAIVAAGGGVTTAFSTQTLLLLLAQSLSVFSSDVMLPLIQCFLAIGICSGLNAQLHLHRLISTVKQVLTGALSILSGLFISVLSLKTAVAAKADMLGVRGLRFVITSVVPVVGGAISEGLISIQSYASLMKSSVGAVGIVAMGLVFLPCILYVVCWRGVLSISLLVADIFDDGSVRLTLTAFKDALLLMNVVLIVSLLTTVVSLGILVAANTGGG